MGKKTDPSITKCKAGENWTKVTFRPDLAKFNMTYLEEDVVALMKKRVVDLAGTLGKSVKVELNGQRLPLKTFADYVNLYLQSASKSRPEPLPRLVLRASEFLIFFLEPFVDLKINSWLIHPTRIAEKANDRWEICVSLSEGQFQQVPVEVALDGSCVWHWICPCFRLHKAWICVVSHSNRSASSMALPRSRVELMLSM